MKTLLYIACFLTVSLNAVEGQTPGRISPSTAPFTYAFGFGLVKLSHSNDLAIIPCDFEYARPGYRIGGTLGYGFDSTYGDNTHSAYLDVPVSFDIAAAGPVIFGLGAELQTFNRWDYDNYYGAHTVGPLFEVIMPIPFQNSFIKSSFGLGIGKDYYDGADYYYGSYTESYFFADINVRTRIRINFNEKVGLNVFFAAPLYVYSGDTGEGYYAASSHYVPDRVIAAFGPCFSW